MQASPRIEELRQKFHENPRRYFAPLANEYRKAGDPEQAIAICRAHLAQQPGHMSGHVVYGQALYDARRPEEARTIFEKALSLDPDNAIVLRQLGDIAREKGDAAEAKHWYSKALDIDPHDTIVAAYIAELTEPISAEESASVETAVVERDIIHATLESPQPSEIAAHAAEPDLEIAETPAAESIAEDVESVAETVEADAEEAVAAATPAEAQGDGTDPESVDAVEPVVFDTIEDSEIDDTSTIETISDREVSVPEVQEPEVESREEVATVDAAPSVAEEDEEDIEAAGEVAWRKTPQPQQSPFITRTMADLYARQGYVAAALDVYRQLAIRDPDDKEIRQRILELSGEGSAPAAFEAAQPVAEPAFPASEPAAVSSETVQISADTRPFEPMTEPFSELTDEPVAEPASEESGLETVETEDFSGLHFTEMELADGSTTEHVELDESPFGELSWGDEQVESQAASESESQAPAEPAHEPTPEPAPEPVAEARAEPVTGPEPEPVVEARVEQTPEPEPEPQVAVEPEPEPEPEAAAPIEEPAPVEPVIADTLAEAEAASEAATPSEARFVDMPVGLGEVQTSIDEAGVAATSPHDEDFPPAASTELADTASAESEVVQAEDEAAEAMVTPEVEIAQPDMEESPVVAYSPEPPRDEDLPHFTPRGPTIREFFATLGAFRPSSGGSSITAHATPELPARDEPVEDLPLATDAFSTLFPDAPVSEEDTRAAFALSGALSGTAHNPTPPTVRTSPPKPVPPVVDAPDQTKESEEDIRRFREWLDGLADS